MRIETSRENLLVSPRCGDLAFAVACLVSRPRTTPIAPELSSRPCGVWSADWLFSVLLLATC